MLNAERACLAGGAKREEGGAKRGGWDKTAGRIVQKRMRRQQPPHLHSIWQVQKSQGRHH